MNLLRKSCLFLGLAIACSQLFLLAGCATLFSGTADRIRFTSATEKVEVYIAGRLVGRTPLEVTVNRTFDRKARMVRVEKEGFRTQEFELGTTFATVAVLNLSSLVSWGIDVLSGAVFEYSPNKYHIELLPERSGGKAAALYRLRRRRVYRFSLYNYDRLTVDAARGRGVYLSALAGLAYAEAEQAGRFLQAIERKRISPAVHRNPYELVKRFDEFFKIARHHPGTEM